MNSLKISLLILQGFIISSISIAQTSINTQNIDIVRDEMGIPHIFTETNAEAVYGIGWTQCEDNFTMMQQNFAISKNLAGKIMGKDGAALDYLYEVFQIDEFVEKRYTQDISTEIENIISAYVSAINKYAESYPKKVKLKAIFPLTVKRVLGTYAFHFNINHSLIMELGKFLSDDFDYEVCKDYGIGSNAFAFNSNKTIDGKSYLVANPHQPVNEMGNWWEVSVHSKEGYEFFGATFSVGSVTPTIGTNKNLGWTHTTNYPHLVDIYKLEIKEDDDSYYLFEGKWKQLDKRKAKLKVKFGPLVIPVTKTYFLSEFGLTVEKEDGFYAMKNSVNYNLKIVEQWYRMGLASNFDEFRTALDLAGLPSQTVTYADKEDNIYHISLSHQPYRSLDFNWNETHRGNTDVLPGLAKNIWSLDSLYPIGALPQIKNPKAGYLYNCNNTVFKMTGAGENLRPSDFPRSFGLLESNTVRANTFMKRLAKYDKVSFEDAREIREDVTVDKYKLSFRNCTNCDDLHLVLKKFEDLKESKIVFDKWNGSFDVANEQASLMAITIMHLEEFVVKHFGNEEKPLPEEVLHECFFKAQTFLMKHYGTLEVPLGEIQKAKRFDVVLPMYGGVNTLANTHIRQYGKNKFEIHHGDSFIFYAKYGKDGLEELQTVNAFGNSTEKGNPFATNQAEMYVNMKTKKAILDIEELRKVGIVYHPK